MQRTSELRGRPIVASDAGEKLGTVEDVLIDERSGRVAALVVGGGLFSKERVLPFEEVQVMGRDAVVVKSQQSVVDARTWRERDASRGETATDRPVDLPRE
jgi:uncharacterized protein YrrD